MAEARRLKRSNVHRCRVMSRGEGGECRTARHGLQCRTAWHGLRYRTARHGLLKMIPHMDDTVTLVRAWLSRSLRRNVPPRRTADTWRAAGVTDLLPDAVIYACDALSSPLLGRWFSPASPGVGLLMVRCSLPAAPGVGLLMLRSLLL